MPTEFRLSFLGDTQVHRRLERVSLHAADASPAFETIADSFVRAERRQYASEGAYGSGGWAALTPAYAAWKARHYPGQPIGKLTGELAESLTDGPAVRVIEPHLMIVGSAVPYGKYLQAGTPRMVARPPVAIPETLRRRWVKILQRWLLQPTDTPMALSD